MLFKCSICLAAHWVDILGAFHFSHISLAVCRCQLNANPSNPWKNFLLPEYFRLIDSYIMFIECMMMVSESESAVWQCSHHRPTAQQEKPRIEGAAHRPSFFHHFGTIVPGHSHHTVAPWQRIAGHGWIELTILGVFAFSALVAACCSLLYHFSNFFPCSLLNPASFRALFWWDNFRTGTSLFPHCPAILESTVFAVYCSSFDGHSVRTKVGSFGIPPMCCCFTFFGLSELNTRNEMLQSFSITICQSICILAARTAKESRWSYPKPTLHKRVSLLHMLVLIGVWWQNNFSLQLMRPGWVNSGFTKLRVWEQDDFVTWKVLMFVTFEVVVKYHRVFCYMNDERKLGGKKEG